MFGKRCTLCGGKLDSNGICKECGLDNKKNDKNYRVNQSKLRWSAADACPYGGDKAAGERKNAEGFREQGSRRQNADPARLRVTGRRSISRLPAADRRCERNGDASDGSASSSW